LNGALKWHKVEDNTKRRKVSRRAMQLSTEGDCQNI